MDHEITCPNCNFGAGEARHTPGLWESVTRHNHRTHEDYQIVKIHADRPGCFIVLEVTKETGDIIAERCSGVVVPFA